MAKVFIGTGRRKSSVAQVKMTAGKGKITVNGVDVREYMPYETLVMDLMQPLVSQFQQSASGGENNKTNSKVTVTQTNTTSEGGRPEKDAEDLTEAGQATRETDKNANSEGM